MNKSKQFLVNNISAINLHHFKIIQTWMPMNDGFLVEITTNTKWRTVQNNNNNMSWHHTT